MCLLTFPWSKKSNPFYFGTTETMSLMSSIGKQQLQNLPSFLTLITSQPPFKGKQSHRQWNTVPWRLSKTYFLISKTYFRISKNYFNLWFCSWATEDEGSAWCWEGGQRLKFQIGVLDFPSHVTPFPRKLGVSSRF